MQAGEPRARPGSKLNAKALATSLLVHSVVLPCVFLWAIHPRRPAPRQEVVEVEIVRLPEETAERLHGLRPSAASSHIARSSSTEEPSDTPKRPEQAATGEGASARVKPRSMLSESVLADNGSSQTRKALSQLAPAEQVEQLCNLEAMAQVGAWSSSLLPDRVVAYATANTQFDGRSFLAEGAALHSGDDWYRLQFKCDLAVNALKVVAFEFLLGDAIPEQNWQEFGLPSESGPSD